MENPEPPILKARARGQLSCDVGFERLYTSYAGVVLGWLSMRVDRAAADDLCQDVWTIFYTRWRRWQFSRELEAPEARPVLSFLFRTCHLTLKGYRRRRGGERPHEPLDGVDVPDPRRAPERTLAEIELGRLLDIARRTCTPDELDVLLAKLAGVPAKEIAVALNVTEPIVDHNFRNAIARLKRQARPKRPRS